MAKLPAHFFDLLYDTLLKSFWRKKSLKAFLRRSHIADSFLSSLDDEESKRVWLDRLFPKLEASDRGQALLQQMAMALSEQVSFPDLENWEDSDEKIKAAKLSVANLKAYLDNQRKQKERQDDIARRKELTAEIQEENIRTQGDLTKLRERLDSLSLRLGEQQAGYDFQDWFYDLMDFADVDNRRPYVSQGRQIDGSITIDGTTYLVELKFEREQTGVGQIDSLNKKVTKNALCTMGIIVAMSSYSSIATVEASTANSPLLLLDYAHLYMVLTAASEFPDVIRRVRRHASQEGQAYLAVSEFGG
jgi:hypothetical protein